MTVYLESDLIPARADFQPFSAHFLDISHFKLLFVRFFIMYRPHRLHLTHRLCDIFQKRRQLMIKLTFFLYRHARADIHISEIHAEFIRQKYLWHSIFAHINFRAFKHLVCRRKSVYAVIDTITAFVSIVPITKIFCLFFINIFSLLHFHNSVFIFRHFHKSVYVLFKIYLLFPSI